jgi:flagellar biosynthesis protein FlhF
MKIKTYTASQLAAALAQIKKELGEEALILSTKEIELKGAPGSIPTRGFEVVAAGEATDHLLPNTAPPDRNASQQQITPAARTAYKFPSVDRKAIPSKPLTERLLQTPTKAADLKKLDVETPITPPTTREPVTEIPESQPDKDKSDLGNEYKDFFRREMQDLKRVVHWSAQSVAGARLRMSDPAADALFVEMIANDLDESLARRIIAEAQARCQPGAGKIALEAETRRALQELISVKPLNEKSTSRIVAAFLGPTGVGKTTTIAKLASLFALEYGKRTLLITLDTYRIGAAEQLRIYAELIGLPILVVSTSKELSQALCDYPDMEIVLIDTIGRAHNRLDHMSGLASFLRAETSIEKHLVLSLTTKPLDLHEIINSFQVFGVSKLLFTKLDETLTSGAAANELVRTRLPLSYLTNGQNVPQDIKIPTPSTFVDQIIAREIPEEVRQAYA